MSCWIVRLFPFVPLVIVNGNLNSFFFRGVCFCVCGGGG